MNRNELLNLLYLNRGATIVGVIYTNGDVVDPIRNTVNGRSREDIEDSDDFVKYAKRAKGATIYSYRASPDMTLAKGDLVVVPAGDTLKLATVVEMHNAIPPELGANVSLRWVAARVDLRRLRELEADEQRVVETVRNAEVKAKLAEIEKSIGVSLDAIETPALLLSGTVQ